MFFFFVGQLLLGFVLLFNSIPFDVALRVFGVFLIALSPMWLLLFKIFRSTKRREIEKQEEIDRKKREDEPVE